MLKTMLHLVGVAYSSRVADALVGLLVAAVGAQVSAVEVHCDPWVSPCLCHDSSLVVALGSCRHNDLPMVIDPVPSNTSFLMPIWIAASLVADTLCSLPMQNRIGRRTTHSLLGVFCNFHTSIQNCPVVDSPLQLECGVVNQDLGCDVLTGWLQVHATARQSGYAIQCGADATGTLQSLFSSLLICALKE